MSMKESHKKFRNSVPLKYGSQEDTNLSLQEKCRQMYEKSYKKYNDFFLKCVEEIEALQPSGYDSIQASRYFTIGVLKKNCKIPDPLTKKQRDRVERLLAE